LTRRRTAVLLSLILQCGMLAVWPLLASADGRNWVTYAGTEAGWHYSKLDQINTQNVDHLVLKWVFQIGDLGKFEATPLERDGVMYGTGQNNRAFALDARTGKAIWRYAPSNLPADLRLCCGTVNRGFAIQGTRLFMATLDAHVIAMDTRTGNVLWNTKAADYKLGYSFTLAPLIVKDKVIVGVSGGEYPIRGFIDAYYIDTGKRAWRFETIPAPGEPRHESWSGDSWKIGGAPAWMTGAYDPELNLIYWPTGNPAPSNYGGQRKGDNLYSNSMLAMNPDTGRLKWFFQFTPHDLWDHDATETPVLIDGMWHGKRRKLLLQANRNAFFYVLDRETGQFLSAKPFAEQNWASEITAQGRPVFNPASIPTKKSIRVCPGALGAVNWNPPSYSPATRLFYVNARENDCTIFTGGPETPTKGQFFFGSSFSPPYNEQGWGVLRAIDPASGDVKWGFKMYSVAWAGVLSTSGDLVFTGDMEGNLMAFNGNTGENLWHFQTGSPVFAAPMSYEFEGKQYIVIAAGSGLFAFGLPDAN